MNKLRTLSELLVEAFWPVAITVNIFLLIFFWVWALILHYDPSDRRWWIGVIFLLPIIFMFGMILIVGKMEIINWIADMQKNIRNLRERHILQISDIKHMTEKLGIIVFVVAIAFGVYTAYMKFDVHIIESRWHVFPSIGLVVIIALMLRGDHTECLKKINKLYDYRRNMK